jgi:hypothetical protein
MPILYSPVHAPSRPWGPEGPHSPKSGARARGQPSVIRALTAWELETLNRSGRV